MVKLVVVERETALLERAVEGASLLASSLILVEVPRALSRVGLDPRGPEVVALLDEVRLLAVEDDLLQAAALLRPPALRSLDAVHLASALSLRDRLDGFVAYDARLVQAAREHGLPVLAPGADL